MRVFEMSGDSGYVVIDERTKAAVAKAPCAPFRIAQGYRAVALGTLGQQHIPWGHPTYVMLRRPTCADLFGLGEYRVEASSGLKVASFSCKPSEVAPAYAIKRVLRRKASFRPPGPYFAYRDYYYWAPRVSRR